MSRYTRWYRPGATYFFTIVTEARRPLFAEETNRSLLHRAIAACRTTRPFDLLAIVLLPDHLHLLLALPEEDRDFSTRLRAIKPQFTRDYLARGGIEARRSLSRVRRGARGVWQRRFWEHLIRDDADFGRHVEYIHFNPVKHGLVMCPHHWAFSSFGRWVAAGHYKHDWLCVCDDQTPALPDFSWANDQME